MVKNIWLKIQGLIHLNTEEFIQNVHVMRTMFFIEKYFN